MYRSIENTSARVSFSNRLARNVATLALAAAGCASLAAQALPVLPQGEGFGYDTPAGRGGTVYRVTNLNASGAGSLQACVAASGPRVCVFEVSGTITANADLVIRNPNITIAGQTAPSPGITWRGGALWVAASDVLVQHIRFRAGDSKAGPPYENRDALKIDSPKLISNIVIDHCTFSWAVDETVSLWKNWNNVTLNNNIISEGLHESFSPLGTGGYGLLIGPWNGRVSVTGNLLAHNYGRNPLSRGGEMLFVNNVVYGGKVDFVDLQSEGLATKNTIVGNVFLRAPDTSTSRSIHIRDTGNWPVPRNSKIYVADNSNGGSIPSEPWSLVSASSGTVPNTMKASQPPLWPNRFTRLPANSNVTLNNVLKNAGARPADRDAVDARVVRQVRDRTGGLINCVAADGTARCQKNAGGWPNLAQNRRTLTLPSNPNGVAPSGYTYLEEWLHRMAAEVEGRTADLPRAPHLN